MKLVLWLTLFMIVVTTCFGRGIPKITSNPSDVQLSIVSGDEQVTLTCKVTGDDIIGVYWERVNSDPLPDNNNMSSLSNDKTTLTMTISRPRPVHTGKYHCVVYSQWGMDKSRDVQVTITIAPSMITKQPTNKKIIALQDVTFTCTARGFGVRYEWKRHKNNTAIGRRSSLTISKTTPLDEDQYYCVAVTKTRGGYAFSNNVTLEVDDQLSIKVQSKATILDEGRTAYFTATASGINMNNYNYQWKKSGSMNLPNKVVGVNGVVLVIPNLTESDEGQYYCIVTNEWGRSVKSNHLTLTVKAIAVTTDSTPIIMPTSVTTTVTEARVTTTINEARSSTTITILATNIDILDNKSVANSYIPTIISACIDSSTDHYKLYITWQFDQNTNLSKIEKFKVLHNVDHKENPIQIYEYPDQTNTDVITNGLTFANHIPLFNITNTNIQVQVAIVANEFDNPPSEMFTTQECSRQTSTSGSGSSNPLSLLAIVVFVIVLVVIIIVTILMLVIIKKCLLKKTQHTQQPSVIRLSTVNNFITGDINIESNPADIKMKSNLKCVKMENNQGNAKNSSSEKLKTENDPADLKMQRNPAYQIMQKEYSYEVKDNYYY